VEATTETARRLVVDQFPQWADLPVRPVERQGNDNRTFRLGDDLAVRLPSHASYVAGVPKEDHALPLLARHLGVRVPEPVATGAPTAYYPHPWSVRRWTDGAHPHLDPTLDRRRFAEEVGGFLRELRAVPAAGGPVAGLHSFYRGCHPSVYGDQVQAALDRLGDELDADACHALWRRAVRTAWPEAPVWFHGDVAVGNLLTRDGGLVAVIDFGTCGVGDPACDLVIAWTFLDRDERAVLRDSAGLDDDTWDRGTGWALWKALVTLAAPHDAHRAHRAEQAATLDRLLADAPG
jgi:aminoglycoside phosphotransferase (APT) family kinase protein